MHFKVAYLKLTLFYVLIVMAISAIFSVVLYNVSSGEIDRGLGRQVTILRGLPFGSQLPDFDELRLQQLDESNNHLTLNLVYFNILILLLSSGASYLLAKKTLSPIKEAMDEQNRFTADASHELRTPLTALRSEIEVSLRDKKLDLSEAKKLLASNLEEIGKLESLSKALLKLARFHEIPLKHFQKVSLEDVLVEAYEKIAILAQQKEIQFKNNFIDLKVLGDHQSLVELFIIILDNAVKYSPEKSKISITIAKDDGYAVIKVKDNGIGIKSTDLPYIFNRFYRADSSRSKEKVDGYGLGLSIAKSIVEYHNGKILATSKAGQGTEFEVKIKNLQD